LDGFTFAASEAGSDVFADAVSAEDAAVEALEAADVLDEAEVLLAAWFTAALVELETPEVAPSSTQKSF